MRLGGVHRWCPSTAHFINNDDRPAVIADTGSSVTFDHFTGERGAGSPYNTRFQNINGYCVTNGDNTTGGGVWVSRTGSTQNRGTALTVSGPTVAEAANAVDRWVRSGFAGGVTQYGDRAYTFGTVPAGLNGAQWIRTANDSKNTTTNPLASHRQQAGRR